MIWKTVLAIIASVGGSGAIILGLSSYVGKLWAERLLQKKSQNFERELETYKKDLSIEVERYKSKAEALNYVSKVQFEAEYETYKSIFAALFDFAAASNKLFPFGLDQIPADMNDRKEEYIRRYRFYVDSFNVYSKAVETNAPFIPKEIYDKFIAVRQSAEEIACMFPEIRIQANERFSEDYMKIASKNCLKTDEFNQLVMQLKIDVRDYLATLKVKDEGAYIQ